jgi:hypothetical protein
MFWRDIWREWRNFLLCLCYKNAPLFVTATSSRRREVPAKRLPLRIIVDALQQFATVDDLRQLARLGAALLNVVPEFLEGVELAGCMG